MNKEIFRIMMEQAMLEWVKTLTHDDPDIAFDPEVTAAGNAVRAFLAWYDKKEMEL